MTQAPAAQRATPSAHARALLGALGQRHITLPCEDTREAAWLWAHSGAMWLTGHADGAPRACPAPLAACAQGAWLALAALCPRLDARFDAFRLLGERAAIAGLGRHGRVSAGGACRLLDTADGMLALNLARTSDRELLHAWLEHPVTDDETLAAMACERRTSELMDRARLLGLAAAPLTAPRPVDNWFRSERYAPAIRGVPEIPLVIDLSGLWAGPLCAQLLRQCGARVVKVESRTRPDGARFGPADFHDLMNAGKESVVIELDRERGRAELAGLLSHADIVIESSRSRALEQMGIRAAEFVAARPGMVWVGISGYGRQAPMRDWIAYGDDAGVAAGLSWIIGDAGSDPVFCGDAIADPLAGLHAALLALAAWRDGGGQLLDVSLYGVVAHCVAAAHVPVTPSLDVALPAARPVTERAVEAGADTARVLREFAA